MEIVTRNAILTSPPSIQTDSTAKKDVMLILRRLLNVGQKLAQKFASEKNLARMEPRRVNGLSISPGHPQIRSLALKHATQAACIENPRTNLVAMGFWGFGTKSA